MASKGPRSRLDHDSRAKRQKALEAPKEPPRPKAHWDHVLEEMAWLSKDFEAERKWKMSTAKRVALRATKSFSDQATRGEKKLKEEEQRLRKVALNISKDVKKFWTKIEKLVLYKYQLEAEEKKKKAMDKQLNFLLGQTERYSTMLAENLVSNQPSSSNKDEQTAKHDMEIANNRVKHDMEIANDRSLELDNLDTDDEYENQSDDEMEDDERTIEEDEAKITEAERREELAALEAEADLPLEEILKAYSKKTRRSSRESSQDLSSDSDEPLSKKHKTNNDHRSKQENGVHSVEMKPLKDVYLDTRKSSHDKTTSNNHCKFDSPKHDDEINGDSCIDQQEDTDFELSDEDGKDDEATLSEEEKLAKKENVDPSHEINLLQKESEMSIEELLARYRKDGYADGASPESDYLSASASSPPGDSINPRMDGADSFQVDKQLKSSTPEEREPKEEIEGDNENENTIEDAAAAARSAQPTGNTFSTTKVRTKFPFLLKFPLREYQHIGLDWLVTMYEKRLNGILADEMGLGKTIMTIALLAHLACEKGVWGPHLIVVPTSVMLNWETEFLKWCPAFKILTYFGSAKERKQKRQGWMKPNYFHVCITTYRLVIQDSKIFKRKKWKYLILDEAHLIKNWKSQRWQTLLNFNSKRRILLTGTPLQNDLMELWSLMHFLMPHVFQSHQEFKDWFCNPISGMVEGQEKINKEVIDRLHNVLRPFILRRLKRDVEKQLPKKQEHVIYCRLSRRQRNLYEDFIASSETQATLASSNFFGMISVIMQLRKVCNHPDLFEGRPIISSFDMAGIELNIGSDLCTALCAGPFSQVDLEGLNLVFTQNEFTMTSWEAELVNIIASPPSYVAFNQKGRSQQAIGIFEEIQRKIWEEREQELKVREEAVAWWNRLQCQKKPVYGTDLRKIVVVKHPVFDISEKKNNPLCYLDYPSKLSDIVLAPVERLEKMIDVVGAFMFAIPASRAPAPVCWSTKGRSPVFFEPSYTEECSRALSPLITPLRPAIVRRQVYFPDRRLVQFDCGKLQELSILLRRLRSEGHRALIFTQMTKMLDVLEEFINLYGYTYMRLDGSTPPEERQTLMQRFNTNPKIFLFILSTRSGGVGINLVGADTVIFYDSDWNPAMDQQAQDRCHRIGQTREVHIYRLISESTIEENILKKANQKRALDDLVIQSGSYNTEFFKKLDPMELFSGHTIKNSCTKSTAISNDSNLNLSSVDLSNADVEAALKHAEDEADYMALKKVEQEEDLDNQEFTEEAIGRSELLDEDDAVNDEDPKPEEKSDNREVMNAESTAALSTVAAGDKLTNENALSLVGGDEEMDMLADVKQMAAAAAAAGQESWSFENQLRPIDRYAMRFLDLWDPIVDRSRVTETAEALEEEWELERIERMKDELEAEIDEDQEPLLYERWDAELATEAYRQHVEALTQQKLLEDMEYEAQLAREREEELERNLNDTREGTTSEKKLKSKKKPKKAKKFKSLKKGKLASKPEVYCSDTTLEPDDYIDDYNTTSPETVSSDSPPFPPPIKKRKLPISSFNEENQTSKRPKKGLRCNSTLSSSLTLPPKKLTLSEIKEGMKVDTGKKESGPKSVVKAKTRHGGSGLTISHIPLKQIMVVKPEKLKKKVGNSWSNKDFVPDAWSHQEDAVLCATVHEYGPHWVLVSDIVHSEFGLGGHRGRSRHPVHCCERFRELFFKHVMSTAERDNTTEKVSSGAGKAILKVTEDQMRLLLNITSELPNNELLLQRHFMAVLSSVWRSKCRLQPLVHESFVNNNPNPFSPPSRDIATRAITDIQTPQSKKWNYNDVRTALASADKSDFQDKDKTLCDNSSNNNVNNTCSRSSERMDLILTFTNSGHEEVETGFPTAVSVSVHGNVELPSQGDMMTVRPSGLLEQSSCAISENRFRMASRACFEGEGPLWATSSAFPPFDAMRYKPGTKHYLWGKNKSPFVDTVRPSKLKSHKNSSDPNDGLYPYLLGKSHIPSPEQTFSDSLDLEYDRPFTDFTSDDTECTLEVAHHEYDPNFTAGLEELQSISDFTDIG